MSYDLHAAATSRQAFESWYARNRRECLVRFVIRNLIGWAVIGALSALLLFFSPTDFPLFDATWTRVFEVLGKVGGGLILPAFGICATFQDWRVTDQEIRGRC